MIEYRTSSYYRVLFSLALASFVVFANLYIPQPLLPLIAKEFGVSAQQSGYSLGAATFGLAIGLLLFSNLSDRLGRTLLLKLSLIYAVLLSLVIGFFDPSWSQLLLLRLVQGILLAGVPAMAVAYMAEELSKSGFSHAVGVYICANSLGGIAGRLLSSWITELTDNWAYAFLYIGGASLIAAIIFMAALPKQRGFSKAPTQSPLSALKLHLGNNKLWPVFIMAGLNFAVMVNQFSYMGFRLSQAPYILPASLLGLLFLSYLAGSVSSAYSGKLSRWLNFPQQMMLGTLLMLPGLLLTLLAPLSLIILGLLITSAGFFLAHAAGSAWVSQQASTAKAGASAVYLVFYYAGASLGGFYLGPFWQLFHWPGVVISSVVLIGLSYLLVHKTVGRPDSEVYWARYDN